MRRDFFTDEEFEEDEDEEEETSFASESWMVDFRFVPREEEEEEVVETLGGVISL